MLGLKEDESTSYCSPGIQKTTTLENVYKACISNCASKGQGFLTNGVSIYCWKNAYIHNLLMDLGYSFMVL